MWKGGGFKRGRTIICQTQEDRCGTGRRATIEVRRYFRGWRRVRAGAGEWQGGGNEEGCEREYVPVDLMLVTWLAMISANALCGLLLELENMEGHRYVIIIQAKHVNLFVLLALPGSGLQIRHVSYQKERQLQATNSQLIKKVGRIWRN